MLYRITGGLLFTYLSVGYFGLVVFSTTILGILCGLAGIGLLVGI